MKKVKEIYNKEPLIWNLGGLAVLGWVGFILYSKYGK
jgi:hypothetical protein